MKVHKHIDEHNMNNISYNHQPILLWNPPFHTPPPHTGSQCWSAFSAMIKVHLQSKGWVATADCQLATFSYFYLASQYN